MGKSKGQPIDWWTEERAALERGFRTVAGIDEAGRGPLAGPVVAACVILPHGADLPGVRDSKQMTPEQREEAYALIREHAVAIGVGVADPETIDRLNILRATHHAMRRALEELPLRPDFVLIDGRPVHPFPVLQNALVKGDSRSASIAAASIVAKVTRDRMMQELDCAFPGYGFAEHKGYPTTVHLEALERLGPCSIHRRSFAPVARLVSLLDDSGQHALPLEPEARADTGVSGETVAAAHLRQLGWEVLCSRYRCRGGEIDLVAWDGRALAFVEVKARHGRATSPAEAVDIRKRARMAVAAEAWLAENGRADVPCRFDVAEVFLLPDGCATVRLIRDAFLAGE